MNDKLPSRAETAELLHHLSLSSCGLCREASDTIEALTAELSELKGLIDSPITDDFLKAIPLEAAHQVKRWGKQHDKQKDPEEWYWVFGYLAGKALHALRTGDREKALHHTISSAATLLNWHKEIKDTGPTQESDEKLTKIPCRKCKGTKVTVYEWESSCGGHEDYRYTCGDCGHAWWVDGIDS